MRQKSRRGSIIGVLSYIRVLIIGTWRIIVVGGVVGLGVQGGGLSAPRGVGYGHLDITSMDANKP